MNTLKEIRSSIDQELKLFDEKFKASLRSKTPILNTITQYIVKRKGKQIRPILVFLSSKISGGIQESTYRGAILIELMHTATLVHDDVVDDSYKRRGFFSLNALWKNKIAVLIGDYLLSKVLLLAVEHKDYFLLELVSTAVKEMSEGELLQIEKARRLDIEEDIYYTIIRQKTASLLASCCAVGAASAGADEESIERMRLFGEYLGMAFQIKDDLFDFEVINKTGKPSGIDIKERKMTLPLIYALNHADKSTRKHIINIVKNKNTQTDKVAEVIDFVNKSGGISYAKSVMNDFYNKALAQLKCYPDGPDKEALEQTAAFILSRQK